MLRARKAVAPVAISLAVSTFCVAALYWNNAQSTLLIQQPSLASLATDEDARMQALWNAAHNDEIRTDNVGHLHRFEMTADRAELLKIYPEMETGKPHTARVTSATKMIYHPRKWLDRQKGLKAAHLQQLWNAADNDEVGGGDSSSDSPRNYHPIRWLQNQKDEAESAALKSHRGYAFGKRIFARGEDHEQNREGSYIDDNSIGLQVEALHARSAPALKARRPAALKPARETSLDMWDQPNPGAAASGGSDGSMTWMGYRSASGGYNRNQSPYTSPGGAQDQQTPSDPQYTARVTQGTVYGAPYSSTAVPNYGYSDYSKQRYSS